MSLGDWAEAGAREAEDALEAVSTPTQPDREVARLPRLSTRPWRAELTSTPAGVVPIGVEVGMFTRREVGCAQSLSLFTRGCQPASA